MSTTRGQLKIYPREIFFEVQNETYLTGQTKKAENNANYEAAANIQVSDDDPHAYKVRRSMSNAFNALKSHIAEFVDEEKVMTNNLIKKAIRDNEAIILPLKLPSNYNFAAFDALGAAIQEFIVKQSVYDFFNITNPSAAASYKAMAADALALIIEAVYRRKRPVHMEEYYDNTEDGNTIIEDAGEKAEGGSSEQTQE